MGVEHRDARTLRPEEVVRHRHTVTGKVVLLVALVLFTILWLMLAPSTAAAAL